MAMEDASDPLQELDINVETACAVAIPTKKKSRNTWTEKHRMALLAQCCVDECNPIGKPDNKSINAAWACLIYGLRSLPERLFDGMSLSKDSVRRHLQTILEKQQLRNKEARGATGRGGSSVQTDEEDLAQRLLDAKEEALRLKSTAKEGEAARKARLDAEGRVRVHCQMHTHVKKKPRSRSSTSSGSPSSRPSGPTTDEERKALLRCMMKQAMEEKVRERAERQWMRKYDLHIRDPENWPHPGPEDVFVERAVEDHRVRLSREVENEVGHASRLAMENKPSGEDAGDDCLPSM